MADFIQLIENFLQKKCVDSSQKLAVAVSGGRDSMSLLYALSQQPEIKSHLYAVTIDHGLRQESCEEAYFVHDWCVQNDIRHEIIVWQHEKKPTINIQEQARHNRYQLLTTFCAEQNIPYLLTAHHALDDIESSYMALQRGSGLAGLAGIPEQRDMGGVTILRPLLNVSREDISAFCQYHQIPFIDDPSNKDTQYERVRVREILQEQTVFKPEHLSLSVQRLKRANTALDAITQDFLLQYVSFAPLMFAKLDMDAFCQQSEEIQLRILCGILSRIRSQDVRLSQELERFHDRLRQNLQKAQPDKINIEKSLFLFDKKAGSIYICRENRDLPSKQSLENKERFVWDQRFEIEVTQQPQEAYSLQALQKDDVQDFIKEYNLSKFYQDIYASIPGVYSDDGLIMTISPNGDLIKWQQKNQDLGLDFCQIHANLSQ